MNTEWCFVHNMEGDLAMFEPSDIRAHLIRVALQVVGFGRNE